MQIICEKTALLNAIQVVENAVSTRNTLPVLNNILIEAKDDNVILVGTDMELTIRNYFKSEIQKEGSITVSAKKISSIVRELPEGTITLQTENGVLIVSCKNLIFKIKGLPGEEFPSFPVFKQSKIFSLKISVLIDMIQKTIYAVSSDEIRYVLNGIFLTIENNLIKMISTDGHRLAYIDNKIESNSSQDINIIIPKKTLHELSRISANYEDKDIEIKISENQVLFTMDSITIISRLIEGKFPDYNKIIPTNLTYKVRINCKEILHATRRVSLISSIKTAAIKYRFFENSMEIIAINPEEGEACENLSIKEYTGEDVTIGYNYRYMIDILKIMDTDEVYLEFISPLNPCVIRPQDKENFINVIMPMKVDKI
ncbi:MAG: DNA polymerase III subunit beta [Candidatus Firestonebacteria bacterium]|nr:DNA polymerase III subunit beta [Candidatus Firestonebacteria bacterium]